ncbi:hypothetical protein NDU88_004679 [Pleurodeles waltl]|uniref:Uncharacterized protein n=1 Tax=Pleurodeles waltl TaxID=8319 RepID=A0AAV7WSN0_PLEWA|nr:hypothetical protein NDU88_004679 [Pleurodeles waltl]
MEHLERAQEVCLCASFRGLLMHWEVSRSLTARGSAIPTDFFQSPMLALLKRIHHGAEGAQPARRGRREGHIVQLEQRPECTGELCGYLTYREVDVILPLLTLIARLS